MTDQQQAEHPAATRVREREEAQAAFAAGLQPAPHGEGDGAPSPEFEAGTNAFRQLRKRAQRAAALEHENRELRTDLAFRDTGLKLNDQQRAAILAVHEGEIDAASLTATAEALHIASAPIPADERAALERIAAATSGAEPSEAFPITLIDEMNACKTPEQLAALLAREGLLQEGD